MPETDYTPGDPPVPVGTIVEYQSRYHRHTTRFEIIDHQDLQDHPHPPPPHLGVTLADAYPDGVAYHLHPADMPKKLDVATVKWVRRERFKVVKGEESRADDA